MAEKAKVVDWHQDKHGDFFGTVAGYGITMGFLAENSGCSNQEIFWDTKLVLGAMRKRVLNSFEAAVNQLIDDVYQEIAEMEEQEHREWRAAVAEHKKWLAQLLDVKSITLEMRQYVIGKCKECGHIIDAAEFEHAIIEQSPRGAFARSFLAHVDDRSGIYSMRRNCVDADTVSLVAAISEEPETTVA